MEPFQLILCLCVSAKARERTECMRVISEPLGDISNITLFVLGQILLNNSHIAVIMHFFLCIVVLILCIYALMLSIVHVCPYMWKINNYSNTLPI